MFALKSLNYFNHSNITTPALFPDGNSVDYGIVFVARLIRNFSIPERILDAIKIYEQSSSQLASHPLYDKVKNC